MSDSNDPAGLDPGSDRTRRSRGRPAEQADNSSSAAMARAPQQDKSQPQMDVLEGQPGGPHDEPAGRGTDDPAGGETSHAAMSGSDTEAHGMAGSASADNTANRGPEDKASHPGDDGRQTGLSPDEAGADGPGPAEQARTGQNAPEAATPRVIGPGDPGYQLRPGDVGYSPPARIAHPAGVVLTNEHLGYTGGADASLTVHGQVPLAMPAPAPATVSSDTSYMRPSVLDKNAATVHLAKMVGDLRTWIMDLPHEVHGELAVVVQFFRDLAARRAALGTAAQLGRTIEPDQVEQAAATPPPEYFQLRHAAQQLMQTKTIYEAALGSAGVELTGNDKTTIDQIAREFQPLSEGPAAPDQVPGTQKKDSQGAANGQPAPAQEPAAA